MELEVSDAPGQQDQDVGVVEGRPGSLVDDIVVDLCQERPGGVGVLGAELAGSRDLGIDAPVKSRGGERCGKGPLSAGQVCDEKTNVREPLLTRR